MAPGPFPSNGTVFEPGPSPWKADEPQYAQKGAGHMPAPHISANRLPALAGNPSPALAEPKAKTADQRTKGGHAGGHNRGVARLGKPGAGLPGATVGPAKLPAVMTLARTLPLALTLTTNLALTGVLLLILRAQLPITLLISLARALREFRGGVTGNRDSMDSTAHQHIRRSGTYGRDLEAVLDAVGVDFGDMGVLARPLTRGIQNVASVPHLCDDQIVLSVLKLRSGDDALVPGDFGRTPRFPGALPQLKCIAGSTGVTTAVELRLSIAPKMQMSPTHLVVELTAVV